MRRFLLDLLYLLLALVTAPWWMRKTRGGWRERFGATDPLPPPQDGRPRLLIHAVSVGEVNATRPLVDALAGEFELVIATTTDTGLARARELYAGDFRVVRYPLDASWAVARFLGAVRPDGVALVELELWPNFLDACARHAIPVGVVNGRLSPRSFKGYQRVRWILRRYFARLAFAGVQDEDYRARFLAMGVPPERCTVGGNTKWDVTPPDTHDAEALARDMGIDRSRPLVVAGSTAPGEDALLRAALPEGVQLLCAPRRPEWRDRAATELAPCVRRSQPGAGDPTHGRFLLDTMGELASAYALADLVVIGRSFVDLHGSDPMEPAAMGKPIVIGPAHSDFGAAVGALDWACAIVISDRDRLPDDVARLLADHDARDQLGGRARAVVDGHRGAASRYADMVRTMLSRPTTQDEHHARA
ncbi:MAG: lipid IV(A) 3-deoxy-D-manno-octulosonic acid transferase [Phycisphaerales bacterium]